MAREIGKSVVDFYNLHLIMIHNILLNAFFWPN